MKVFKFGGASIKSAEAIENVANIIASHSAQPLAVVISALGKTTNALEEVVQAVYDKQAELAAERIKAIEDNHLEIARKLFADEKHPVFMELANNFERLYDIQRFYTLKNITIDKGYDFLYDLIVSYGELISTTLVSYYLKERDLPTYWLDVRTVIKTDHHYREGKVNWDVTRELVQAKVAPLVQSQIVLTQGFIGGTVDNNTTTLGREGSDYTAAILAFCLNAEEVTIWKDVPGVLSADPRHYPDAELLNSISYSEAVELAYYGATVIHPKTIKPLENKNITLRVHSFVHPDEPGTIISRNTEGDGQVPSCIFKPNQVLIKLSPKDFSFIIEENLSEIFKCFADHNVKVGLMQNSAINFSACITCDPKRLNSLVNELGNQYAVSYTENALLTTIRHYKPETIKSVIADKHVLLSQESDVMARFVTA